MDTTKNTMRPLNIHTRIHVKATVTGGGIAAMVLNAWKGHLLSRRQREQLYATGSKSIWEKKSNMILMILRMLFWRFFGCSFCSAIIILRLSFGWLQPIRKHVQMWLIIYVYIYIHTCIYKWLLFLL